VGLGDRRWEIEAEQDESVTATLCIRDSDTLESVKYRDLPPPRAQNGAGRAVVEEPDVPVCDAGSYESIDCRAMLRSRIEAQRIPPSTLSRSHSLEAQNAASGSTKGRLQSRARGATLRSET
jgi:hypothetical protein